MRAYNDIQREVKDQQRKEFQRDIAKRNQGVKNISKASTKETVQEVKAVREVTGTFTTNERKESEQTMFDFRVWVQSQVVDASRQAAATTA